jgi:hypothetical protein
MRIQIKSYVCMYIQIYIKQFTFIFCQAWKNHNHPMGDVVAYMKDPPPAELDAIGAVSMPVFRLMEVTPGVACSWDGHSSASVTCLVSPTDPLL